MDYNQAIKSIGSCKECGGSGVPTKHCENCNEPVPCQIFDECKSVCPSCKGTGNAEIIERIPINLPEGYYYYGIHSDGVITFAEFHNKSSVNIFRPLPLSVGQKVEVECENCHGTGYDGHDRCLPPNPYFCDVCNGHPKLTVTVKSVEVQDRDFVITGRVR